MTLQERKTMHFGSMMMRAAVVTVAMAGVGCDLGPVVTQDTEAGEHAYRELTQSWLEWAMALPWSTGPITDETGDQCALGQEGRVWYLAGTPGGAVERSCTIPRNKYLYFPLLNLWSIPRPHLVDTDEELANFVAFFTELFPERREAVCSLTLRLDGEDLLGDTEEIDAETWVALLEPFEIEVNDDNFVENPESYMGGTYPAALLLRPLEPGDHVLEFGGAECDENGDVDFEVSAVYNLFVEG
jgi:hypothetical protein